MPRRYFGVGSFPGTKRPSLPPPKPRALGWVQSLFYMLLGVPIGLFGFAWGSENVVKYNLPQWIISVPISLMSAAVSCILAYKIGKWLGTRKKDTSAH